MIGNQGEIGWWKSKDLFYKYVIFSCVILEERIRSDVIAETEEFQMKYAIDNLLRWRNISDETEI